MTTEDWNHIRPHVSQILSQQRYPDNGETCFLTAYQIAVLVDEQDGTLKGALKIGGKGIEEHASFAQQIARYLSKDYKEKHFDSHLEMRFFSTAGLDGEGFAFDSGHVPSERQFSMFRWTES